MKKSVTKKKRTTVGKAKAKAWREFSRYIRLRDSLATTKTLDKCACITCGEVFPTFYLDKKTNYTQAGHAIDGRGKNILFDEDLVNGQCRNCNCIFNGRLPEYAHIMIKKYGIDWWEDKLIFARKPAAKPWNVNDLIEIELLYKDKIKVLTDSAKFSITDILNKEAS